MSAFFAPGRRRRRYWIGALLLLGATALLPGCSPMYVLRAGWEEAGILWRREKIDELIESDQVAPEIEGKLKLVAEARRFALTLNLEPKESFTYYSTVDRDVLAWVLSAAPKTSLENFTWWFPVVGKVPYKGFFEKEDALAAAKDLSARNYDVYVRPSQAFSTLGWFNDPILSTMIKAGDVTLVDTVIHEILHNTLWVKDHVSFNESLANFVGAHGAVAFFAERAALPALKKEAEAGAAAESPELQLDRQRLESAQGRLADQLLFARFINDLSTDLKALYGSADFLNSAAAGSAPSAAQLELRESVFSRYRSRFDEMRSLFRSPGFKRNLVEINNASVIADSLYYDRLWEFEEVFEKSGSSLADFILAMKELADKVKKSGGDPFLELERLRDGLKD